MTRPMCASEVRAFFVYGTLMRGECNHAVVARHGLESVRAAWVQGVLFDTGCGYPALRLHGGGARVQGEVIVPGDVAAAMRSMDDLEGYFGPGEADNLYERRLVEVTLEDGGTCQAWTYEYAQDLPPQARIGSGCWRDVSGTRVPPG